MGGFFNKVFPQVRDVRLFGVLFLFLWMALATMEEVESFLAASFGVTLSLLAIALLARRGNGADALLARPSVAAAAALCMVLPAVPIAASGAPAILFWALGGLGFGLSMAAWFARISTRPLATSLAVVTLGLAMAFLIVLLGALFGIDEAGKAVLVATAALANAVLLVVQGGEEASMQPKAGEPLPAPSASFLVGLLAPFALLALYFGFSHSFPTGIVADQELVMRVSALIGVLLTTGIFVWLFARVVDWEHAGVVDAVAMVLVLAGLVVLFADRNDKVVLLSLQVAARGITVVLLWLLAGALARRGTYRAVPLFATVLGGYSVLLCVGLAVGSTPAATAFLLEFPQEGIFLFTACMAAAIAYGLANVEDFSRETASTPELKVVLETDFLDAQCDLLGKERGLSEREIEIVKLLAHGRSRSYIAESLYLSENTVKWYCRQIYQKLDIHKKQELLTLLGVE